MDNGYSSYSQSPTFPIHLCFFLVLVFLFTSLSWNSSYSHQSPTLPLHFGFFLVLVFLVMGLSWYFSYSQSSTLSLHLCFFLVLVFLFMGLLWYINYESMFEGLKDQVKLVLIVSPLLLLLVVHLLSNEERRWVPSFIPLPEKDSLHRAGGTPWGVGALLVFLCFMISYKAYFQERWFPLLSRG